MVKRLIYAVLVLVLFIAAGAATAQSESSTVYAQLGQDWDVLDPHLTNTSIGYQVAITFYDRLVALDDDGNVIPSLATSWEGSGADQLTLNIHPDAVCADGSPMGAEAVANSLIRMGANDTGSPYMYRTLGGNAGATEERYSVEFDSEANSVTMIMHEPFSGLLIGLAMPWTSVICPAGLEDPESMAGTPQGSGPFVLAESNRGDRYVVTARPEYTWGARGISTSDEGFPQTVVYQVVVNETTAANLFLSGDLNIASVTGPDYERVAAADTFSVTGNNFGAYWFQVNQDEGLIGNDPAIRQAVYKAISSQEYLDVGWSGQGVLSNTFIAPGVHCYDESLDEVYAETVAFDPEGARQALRDAGYTEDADGKFVDADGNLLTLRFIDYAAGGTDSTELLILSLEDVGFTIDANIVDFGGYVELLFRTGEWDAGMLPYGPPVPLPSAAVGFLSGDSATNTANLKNPIFDEAWVMANATSGEESCAHWSRGMRAQLENFDLKPMFSTSTTYFGQGVEFTLFNNYIGTWDPLTTRIVDS